MVEKWKVRLIKRKGRSSFEAVFTDPRTGERHRKTLKTSNKREAEREAGRIEAELREGQWRATRTTRWKDFRTKYETEGMFDLAPASVRLFQNAAAKLEKLVGPATLQSLTEDKLNSFTVLCLEEGLSKQTVAAYLRHLKAALRWAVSQKLLLWKQHIRCCQFQQRGDLQRLRRVSFPAAPATACFLRRAPIH
jgi:hypothetical protein